MLQAVTPQTQLREMKTLPVKECVSSHDYVCQYVCHGSPTTSPHDDGAPAFAVRLLLGSLDPTHAAGRAGGTRHGCRVRSLSCGNKEPSTTARTRGRRTRHRFERSDHQLRPAPAL